MPRHRHLPSPSLAAVLLAGLAPCLAASEAPDWSQCPAPPAWVDLPPGETLDPDSPIDVSAEHLDAGETGESILTGDVVASQQGRRLMAERMVYDPDRRVMHAEGDVRYADPDLQVRSDVATYHWDTETGSFGDTRFRLPVRHGRGTAQDVHTVAGRESEMQDLHYTTCPADREMWRLRMSRLDLDHEEGMGTGRNVRLEVGPVPIFYSPYLSFPIDDRRHTGFLVPEVGSSGHRGTEMIVPYYLNLAPNYDATLTARHMSELGTQLITEFRYLTPKNQGQVDLEFLPSDDLTGEDRGRGRIRNSTRFDRRWSSRLDVNYVSDIDYFRDIDDSRSRVSTSHIRREADIRRDGEHWDLSLLGQSFQTLDGDIPRALRPYARAPRIGLDGHYGDLPGGLVFRMDNELVRFDRDTGVTGERFDLRPRVSREWRPPGYRFESALALRHTRYQLEGVGGGAPTDPSRTLPSLSLDGRVYLERDATADGRILQTLEPRLRYVYTPFRDQDDLPIFDTREADLNMVQLFRDDRFVGSDRVGDANQLAMGVTTAFRDQGAGRELASLTVGQILYFRDLEVTRSPGARAGTDSSSDLIVELDTHPFERWSAGLDLQWDPHDRQIRKGSLDIRYRAPEEGRVVNTAYRFRRGRLEQTDLSLSWRLSERINLVGRWNYDITETQTLDRFLGIEYETCCWAVRAIARRYLVPDLVSSARFKGEADSSLMLQFEFKGLTSVGRAAGEVLERGILGYSSVNP